MQPTVLQTFFLGNSLTHMHTDEDMTMLGELHGG
jgi:hypothetical protein